MTNKEFSRKTESINQNYWISEGSSRENIEIFLCNSTLHEWSIARPTGRARIETLKLCNMSRLKKKHRPANWSGAD
jgi:hypothetical protein